MNITARASLRAQAKLKVSSPGDEYEREADRVAAGVLSAPEPRVQRACACGGECSKCKAGKGDGEHQHVMRAGAGGPAETFAPSSVEDVLAAPGRPMDAATRAFFEPRLGHDFGRVRVHTDAQASRSAQSIGARAYTVGSHIVFGEAFAPQTPEGRSLLAHELVHVVQQDGGASHAGQQVQRQVGDQQTVGTGGTGATELSSNGCHTCDMEGGVGVCCYRNAPMVPECFDLAKSIVDSCKDSSEECNRQAQCAQCKCIAAKLGQQYCQCSGIS